jgi:hypothetical protein
MEGRFYRKGKYKRVHQAKKKGGQELFYLKNRT